MSDGIREIYNEGRVVGLSAYEMYVRNLIASDPDATPPTEQEWLSTMLGNGSAMILKINSNTTAGVHDYVLPSTSVLCGCNTIFASVFNGDCTWAEFPTTTDSTGYWATSVKSYGGLVLNNNYQHPTSSAVPYSSDVTPETKSVDAGLDNILNFCKITDGVLLQQGTWVDATHDSSNIPNQDLTYPDLGSSPTIVRLRIEKNLSSDVLILLTGFMDSSIVDTISGLYGSTNPDNNDSANGGFLGPAIFPWASKIIMIYPNLANFINGDYRRSLPTGIVGEWTIGSYTFQADKDISTESAIDMDTIDIDTYYTVNQQYSDSAIPMGTSNIRTFEDGINVLAVWHPGMTSEKLDEAEELPNPDDMFFPPALYGAKVPSNGGNVNLVPVDVAAPGTIKLFTSDTVAANYVKQVPNTFALSFNLSTGALKLYYGSGSGDISTLNTSIVYDPTLPEATITSDIHSVTVLALSNSDGTPRATSGTSGTTYIDYITWDNLITILGNNNKIDILDQLLGIKNTLPDIEVTGHIRGSSLQIGTSSAQVTLSNSETTLYTSGDIVDGSGRTFTDYVSRGFVVGVLSTSVDNAKSITFTDSSFLYDTYAVYEVVTSIPGVRHSIEVTNVNSTVSAKISFKSPHPDMIVGVRCYLRKQ